jgi:hypothetical protein
MKKLWILIASVCVLVALAVIIPCMLRGGEVTAGNGYQILAPIKHGNLSIFPVASSSSHDTHAFLTLDEGLRSGEVIVSESGSVSPLVRPRHGDAVWRQRRGDGAQVNRLVLVNNSKRPLLLLAGEIVTGGKQDRIIGKDRLIPAESDPVDLSVFCVEPGRWVATSGNYNFKTPVAMGGSSGAMVQPSVRSKAMADKDQHKVWDEVAQARQGMSEAVTIEAAPTVAETSSYANVIANEQVQHKLESVAVPMQQEYQSVIRQLHEKNAVGVVVAVNGEIIWADVFASASLLEKYWPKLVRSYAAEAMVQRTSAGSTANAKSAQEFLARIEGKREVVENEPGLYRHTEISGDGFKAFELTSLLPGSGFDLHIAKMSD